MNLFLRCLVSFLTTLPAFALPRSNAVPEKQILQHSACQRAVRSQLEQWENHRQWERVLEAEPGELSYQTPTSVLGVWLALTTKPEGIVEALWLSPERTVRLHWKKADCRPIVTAVENPRADRSSATSFRDADLRTLVKASGRGVVYAWSPGMPHSLAGIDAIRAATAKAGIPLTLVVDPYADAAAVKETLAAKGLSEREAKRIQSIELFRRGMLEHYPSVLVYRDQKIEQYAYSGYNSAASYRKFFKRLAMVK